MKILSILMATTPDRSEMFVRLYNEIQRQISYMDTFHSSLGEIEVLVDDSKRFLEGGLSIGKKREALLNRVTGKYMCYLDSDESIAPNYLETLVRLCHQDKDACTFRAIAKTDHFWGIINMGLTYPDLEASPNFVTLRNVWHVCPIKTTIAKEHKFNNISYGEDIEWLLEVRKHLTSEAKAEIILLQYNHSEKHSEADKIIKHLRNAI